MTAPEVNFSELSNQPRRVVAQVEHSHNRAVLIRRRSKADPDLLLQTAERARQEFDLAVMVTQLLRSLIRIDSAARSQIAAALPEVYPWVRFLPEHDAERFAGELLRVLEAAESVHAPQPVHQLVAEWRHTAEIHADPELLAALHAEPGDFGDVAEPGRDAPDAAGPM